MKLEIFMKKFVRSAHFECSYFNQKSCIHSTAQKLIEFYYFHSQKELFLSKLDPGSPKAGERKMSTSSSTSMKTKWLKAFRSLKPASGSGNDR